ncbi:hypothetical protein KU6B_47490 [Mameliella alba]|uniref:hypothetical protein n=1 Tax=Mameliella alba TaxID=561184 RepID=UPI0013E4EFAB|nr:hypothetical protein [Mameliella alba]BBU58484.1 hypothetical protein KU6B_47490 [Mameliella alba]
MTRLAIALAVALCAALWLLWDAWQDKDAAEAEAALYARQIAQARVAEGWPASSLNWNVTDRASLPMRSRKSTEGRMRLCLIISGTCWKV